jgi:hypothetical protein
MVAFLELLKLIKFVYNLGDGIMVTLELMDNLLLLLASILLASEFGIR